MKALKTFIIYLIVLSNLGSMFAVPLVYLNFELRKEYIQTVLCVKREQPIIICGGQCYLNLQLEKARQTEDTPQDISQHPSLSLFFVEQCSEQLPPRESIADVLHFTHISDGFPSDYQERLFRPPSFS